MPSGSTMSSWSNGKDICLPSRWCGFDSRWGLHAPVSQLEEDAGSGPVRSRFESGREYYAAWQRPSDPDVGHWRPACLGCRSKGVRFPPSGLWPRPSSEAPDCGSGCCGCKSRRSPQDVWPNGRAPPCQGGRCGFDSRHVRAARIRRGTGLDKLDQPDRGDQAQALIAQVDRATVYEAVRSRFESWWVRRGVAGSRPGLPTCSGAAGSAAPS